MTISTTFLRDEYPRPQFVRKDWLNLNGEWEFQFDDSNIGEKEKWYQNQTFSNTINVPFTFETKASGIGEEAFHSIVWYRKTITNINRENKRTILHFQASDFTTKVWVDGESAGNHVGGYTAFSLDITDKLNNSDEHTIVVKVEDSQSCEQPRGKQRWMDKNFGCWYVQTTGIWQTVWLEFLPEVSLNRVKMTPDIDTDSINLEFTVNVPASDEVMVETVISFDKHVIRKASIYMDRENAKLNLNLLHEFHDWKIQLWSPKHPNLYDVTFKLYQNGVLIDEVESYFGMRKISTYNGNVLLNNMPVYQKLILDQGYWTESHLTPPSDAALVKDIELIKEMGYNGVRKHQKIEDPRFYYWCDKKGLLVWAEMPSTYEYTDKAVENFTKEWLDVVNQFYNHPSIVTWVPFNESWGVKNIFKDPLQQRFTEGIYYLTKAVDSMRPVIVNDGWEHTISDIITLHDYESSGEAFFERYKDKDQITSNGIAYNQHKFCMAEGYEYKGQPILISEFGGVAFMTEEGWGYGEQVKTEGEFFERVEKIHRAVQETPYVCGYCYTQLTDVQQEVNGFLTESREYKVSLEKIKEINKLPR
ncbi:glycoside hydrolase family 2 protein [Neobacillus niacini]|uniref:glycoside hydrolase family 2 protein n=1 Tax=Neobacillus niacini TaxID=86668 RepID=UPI002FFE892E